MTENIKTRIKNNIPEYLCYVFVLTIIFSFFKLIVLITAFANDFYLPGYYFADFLMAVFISLIVFINLKVCKVVSSIIIFFYLFNTIFIYFFSSFINNSVAKLVPYSITIISSFNNIKILIFILILFYLPVLLTMVKIMLLRKFRNTFTSSKRKKLFIIIAACFLLFTMLNHILINFNIFGNKINYNNYSRGPVSTFIISFFRTSDIDENVQSFEDISEYNSEPMDKLSFNNITDTDFNIILIYMESTGSISVTESEYDIMPNFHKLSENGIYWNNFYASIPQSIKSIFSGHTGLFPYICLDSISSIQPEIPVITIADYFKENNYSTALMHAGFFEHGEKDKFLNNRGYDFIYDADTLPVKNIYETSPWGIDDEAIFDYVKTWISENNNPFFITLIPIFPHHPYDPPEHWDSKFPGNSILENFHNSVHYEDYLLGELITYLKENDLFDNTIFVLFGDHGEAFGQHTGNFYHYGHIYEENIKVPLLISNPRLFDNAVKTDNPGVIADILPTVIDLLGWKNKEQLIHGKSLFKPEEDRLIFYTSQFGDLKYGLRDGNFKFIIRPEISTVELYDLSIDPGEKNNIYLDYPERIEYYKEKVFEWRDYTMNTLNSF